jgi:hypothetical protein
MTVVDALFALDFGSYRAPHAFFVNTGNDPGAVATDLHLRNKFGL